MTQGLKDIKRLQVMSFLFLLLTCQGNPVLLLYWCYHRSSLDFIPPIFIFFLQITLNKDSENDYPHISNLDLFLPIVINVLSR